ncbi:MAG: zinc-dependent alcohol dehydrogenase family protein [Pseudomonadota bacterium]
MTKKIVVFEELGGPDVLKLVPHEERRPAIGEVRLEVKALGLNRAEALFRQGKYLEIPELPSRIGYEASGVVEAIGNGVTSVVPGDVVSVVPAFEMGVHGVYGETAVVPARAVIKHPSKLSFSEAAAVWMQYLTAYGALFDIGYLTEGKTILITAASSSVGIAAIQLAREVGATAIATTRGHLKKERLLEAGASAVIVTDEENVVEAAMSITDGKGVDLIFDPVAGAGLGPLAEIAAPGSQIIVYGALDQSTPVFPLFPALAKGLSLRGYTLFEITNDDERLAAAVRAVGSMLEAGRLTPVIDRTFTLPDICEAHAYLESNLQFGKIVVSVP